MRTSHWISSALATVTLWVCLPGSISAQTATSPTINIRVTQPQSVSQNISQIFTGQVPASVSLRVTAEGAGWWFIRFEAVPDSAAVIGDLPGTAAGGVINPGQWYPFRQPVTLTVLVEPSATSPLSLRYLLGRVAEGQPEPGSSREAQQAAQKRAVRIEGKEQFVKLFWQTERPVITTNPATMDFLVYENTYYVPQELTIESVSAGWSFIRLRGIPDNLKIRVVETAVPDVVTLAPGGELVNEQWYGFKQILKLQVSLKDMISSASDIKLTIESGEADLANDGRAAATAAINGQAIVLHGGAMVVPISLKLPSMAAIAKAFLASTLGKVLLWGGLILLMGVLLRVGWRSYQTRQARRAAAESQEPENAEPAVEPGRPNSTANGEAKKRRRWGIPNVFGRGRREEIADPSHSELAKRIRTLTPATGKLTSAPPGTTQSPDIAADVAQAVQSHTKRLRDIEQKLTSLEGLVLSTYKTKDRLAEIEQLLESRTPPAPNKNVDEQAVAKLKNVVDELRADASQESKRLSRQIQELEQAVSRLANQLAEQQAQGEETRRLVEGYGQQVRPPAAEPPRSTELAVASEGSQDGLYARLLGLIFAGNIDSLNKESFDAMIQRAGEMLNRFFQEELPLAHDLEDLAARVKDMVTHLEQIASQGSAINKETYGDLRLGAERARRLSREITSLQTQLQNREIELDLQIRVSTSPAGHAIFLEELGRAIKQAMDKFTDPQAYIERRLDRFVTQEVIGVVDLCDRDVAPPGEHEALEQLVKALCQAAQLKPILPIAMEPYQPSEHNIVEWVSGSRSQAIARATRRGFYYKDQVLRKADVVVYK